MTADFANRTGRPYPGTGAVWGPPVDTAYAPEVYTCSVAVGGNVVALSASGNRLLTPDRGRTFDQLAMPNFPRNWQGIAVGNAVLVAVASDGLAAQQFARSTNGGVTWTPVAAPVAALWRDVAFGNGVFCAINASGGGTELARSIDGGVTFLPVAAPNANAWASIDFIDGVFVAVSSNGVAGTRTMRSVDGAQTFAVVAEAVTAPYRHVRSGLSSLGVPTLLAVSDGGLANTCQYSTDLALTWQVCSHALVADLYRVCWGNSLFIATAWPGANPAAVANTADGTYLQSGNILLDGAYFSTICWAYDRFIAFSDSGFVQLS